GGPLARVAQGVPGPEAAWARGVGEVVEGPVRDAGVAAVLVLDLGGHDLRAAAGGPGVGLAGRLPGAAVEMVVAGCAVDGLGCARGGDEAALRTVVQGRHPDQLARGVDVAHSL